MNMDILERMATASTDVTGLILCYYFFSSFFEKKKIRKVRFAIFFALTGTFLLISNQVINQQYLLTLIAIITHY